MASRRHRMQIATALSASRLPLGTPNIATPRSPPTSHDGSQTSQRSPKRHLRTNSSFDKENDSGHLSGRSSEMEVAQPPDNLTGPTLAEAKLQCQKQRIEQAEAALKAPAIAERQASRPKKQAWKVFDYTADASQPGISADGGVPLPSEVRVNTFRPAPSRAASFDRSMSSLSQRTSNTGPSEMERQDSALVDAGFQLYTARRARRNFDSLGAYEDKPEEKQTTVEATFDKREIYEVFGNALPGPEFMEQNVGGTNGQLRFVQHPNGDVSAHQWSAVRYIWENIGQYSNIRKRIEGQLASDRLKGETAHQTLQQNTLVYFKTVAKQREANVMGVPFGSKEIQAAIPITKPVEAEPLPARPRRPSLDNHTGGMAPLTQYQPGIGDNDTQRTIRQSQLEPEATPYYGGQHFQPGHLLGVPTGPRASHIGVTNGVNTHALPLRYDDPFYSQPMSTYQSIYGGYAFQPPATISVLPLGQSYDQLPADLERPQRLQYNTFGQLEQSDKAPTQHQATSSRFLPRYGTVDALREPDPTLTSAASTSQHSIRQSTAEVPRPKPVIPLSTTRSQMLGHLKRLGHQAEERRRSQDKIRTVLYDPFRDSKQSTATAASHGGDGISPRSTMRPPPAMPHFSSYDHTEMHDSLHVPNIAASAYLTPTIVAISESLKDSSPDTYWDKRATDISTRYLSSSSCENPTPQNFKGPFFSADTPAPRSMAKSSGTASGKPYDQELKDWWTSSNSFMRQEDFYQSVRVVDKPPVTPTQAAMGTAADQKPSTSKAEGFDMTRLLIPVLENLASYVQGPLDKRRDYFSQWAQPPEWCIDRSANGNRSFFDAEWGQPPQRLGRDPRYRPLPEHVQFGGFAVTQTSALVVGSMVELGPRFGGGRLRREI